MLHPPPQFVEYRNTAVNCGSSIHCRLDSSCTTIKQADTKRKFQLGNRSRNDRMGHGEMFRRPQNAAVLCDCEENMKIA